MKRNKNNLTYGHEYIECPICHHNTFDYISYSEYEWGTTVEQHGYCDRCGYMVEQVYSPSFECFSDRKKGFKDCKGIYHAKNVKKHKRIRRKCNYDTKIEINPTWSMYV